MPNVIQHSERENKKKKYMHNKWYDVIRRDKKMKNINEVFKIIKC